ncbi:MAG: hypothetical protein ACI855_004996 [Myxococcota bacterium]
MQVVSAVVFDVVTAGIAEPERCGHDDVSKGGVVGSGSSSAEDER